MLKWFGNIELAKKFICSMRGYRKTWTNSFANPVSETRLMLEGEDVYMGSLALGVMCVCTGLCKGLGCSSHHAHQIVDLWAQGNTVHGERGPFWKSAPPVPSLRPDVNVLLLNLQWDRWGHLATWFHWSASSQANWEAHYQWALRKLEPSISS